MPGAEPPARMADLDRLRPAPDVLTERVGQEFVLNDQGHGQIHVLNATGGRVWEMCGEGVAVAEIAQRLGADHGLSAELVRDDVDSVLRDLLARNLLTVASDRSPG
jgi:hypothetical protein